jgi:misacylated tRNA(Ala) deacylase
MPTALLYQTDAYQRAFEATVTATTPEGVVLDQTAFYAGGGGQPADSGKFADLDGAVYTVTGLKRVEGELVHVLADTRRPPTGKMVHCALDWDRRYLLMRTHTALHILCGVVWRDYKAQVTGGNMEPGRARMDFEFEQMDKSLVAAIEQAVNAEVAAARPIRVRILPREEAFQIPDLIRTKINLLPEGIAQVRTVDIVGLDLQADGGTHVANTEEVGRIAVVDYHSKGRINKRLVIQLG